MVKTCFLYAIRSILHYENLSHSRNKTSSYAKWTSEINLKNISLPVNMKDLPKFEKLNNIKVNVHLYENGLKGIRYNSNFVGKKTVNLLLVVNKNEAHYCGIRKLSRLYYNQFKSHHKFICERCTQSFSYRHVLEKHHQFCIRGKAQIEKMPKQKDVELIKEYYELSPPLIIYADTECLIDNKTHKPAAVGVYHVWDKSLNGRYPNQYYKFEGGTCILKFLKHLDDISR